MGEKGSDRAAEAASGGDGADRAALPKFRAATTHFSEAELAGFLWHKVELGSRPLGAEGRWCWGGSRHGRWCLGFCGWVEENMTIRGSKGCRRPFPHNSAGVVRERGVGGAGGLTRCCMAGASRAETAAAVAMGILAGWPLRPIGVVRKISSARLTAKEGYAV